MEVGRRMRERRLPGAIREILRFIATARIKNGQAKISVDS
jgi:hypothetical protein